jgi:hypothetical protein
MAGVDVCVEWTSAFYFRPLGYTLMHFKNEYVIYATVILAIICLLFHSSKTEGFRPDLIGSTNQPRQPTIFVSVASYRDSECSKTIDELFKKAKFPHRVFIGVCEQNSSDPTETCGGDHDSTWDKQIRTIRVPHTDAKGPCVARYMCSTLYGGEDFYMQIDSHTVMVEEWDEKAVTDIMKCPDPSRSVLSMYPNDKGTYTTSSTDVPVMCKAKFNDKGLPIFEAAMKPPSFVGSKPRPNGFIAAGFFFAPKDFVKLVPFDPELPHLFQGEEILLSARAWTSGFDIFTPTVNICLHHYLRNEKPKFWNDVNKAEYEAQKSKSETRARRILGLEEPRIDDKYSLGKIRPISEYWRLTGVDPASKTTTSPFC